MHNIWGLSQVGHLHPGRWHVYVNSHEGMMLLGLQSLMLPMSIRVRQRVVGKASNVSLVHVLFYYIGLPLDY
jgi:hypothetical protein